jgi:predicted nucleic acid-binding protein
VRREPLIVDTGGLLRALADDPRGKPAWPDYRQALSNAARVIVPSSILPEVDYFMRDDRPAMRRLVAEIFDPATTYEYEHVQPTDIVRALVIDAKFHELALGLVDGSVAAVAERRGVHRVLTSDRRDFASVRIGSGFATALVLVP